MYKQRPRRRFAGIIINSVVHMKGTMVSLNMFELFVFDKVETVFTQKVSYIKA